MPLANSALDVILQLAGLFYAFAGYIGVRAVHRARLLDAALDELSGDAPIEKTPLREHRRMLWLLTGALITMAGGIALILQIETAAPIFFLSATLQFAYLLAAAPYYFDQSGKDDGSGRQRSVNAAILYAGVTVFVLWALQSGHLKPLSEVPGELVYGAALAVAGYTAYAFWKFLKPLSSLGLRRLPTKSEDEPG